MRTTAKRLVVLGFVAFSVGCSQGSSTSGVEDRGEGPPVVAKTKVLPPSGTSQTPSVASGKAKSLGRTLALGHAIHPGRAVRWPSRVVSVSTNEPWARNAAHLWVQKGFHFRMGTGKQIEFMGYSTARNAVGWSKFDYRGGKITQCRIWINPTYLRRYDIANTFAHEIGHCLGLGRGHIGVRGTLMSKYGGNRIAPQTVAMFNYLYSVKPGARL